MKDAGRQINNMTKRKFTVSIDMQTFIALNVYAAQQNIRLSDLAQQIFEGFVKNSAKNDNTSVS
jgi:hypothetical protein